ncbi:MAG: flagellar filament outer layer protein FlaA [Treponema sp.]|nr:flagellar filament outer layer protein FlaA [Treponema sp.]
MKQSSFRAICLILMACIAVLAAFGDDHTVVLETKVLETFDNFHDDDQDPKYSKYDWRLDASKFATKPKDALAEEVGEAPFPRLMYVPAYPVAIFGNDASKNEGRQSLGIWGKFDRRGYNWIDIYPVEAGADENAPPAVIPIPGRIQYLDMWVWGSNLRYTLEAYFRDHLGVMHVINLGSINHTGWKNLRAQVPSSVPQAKTVLPRLAALEFVKFRVWTDPTERVDNFYIYFDQFNILMDTFETPYDGDILANPGQVQELWNGGE